MAGVSLETICKAAWSSQCMFAQFYQFNMAVHADIDFHRRVLQVAGTSAPSKGIKKKYGLKKAYKTPKLKKS